MPLPTKTIIKQRRGTDFLAPPEDIIKQRRGTESVPRTEIIFSIITGYPSIPQLGETYHRIRVLNCVQIMFEIL